jgi:hypothetical protein
LTEPSFDSEFSRIPDPIGERAPAPLPALAARPGPSRSERRRRARVAWLVASGWVFGQLAIAGIRSDMPRVPLAYTLACGVGPVVAGLVCFTAAIAPGRLGLGARAGVLAALALLMPLSFVVSGYALSPPYPEAPAGTLVNGVFCLNVALAWTLVPLVAAGLALRGAFAAGAGARSLLVGLAAGLFVATTSMLRCPLSDPWHMALSHGGAVVASALLGAFVLARVTRA